MKVFNVKGHYRIYVSEILSVITTHSHSFYFISISGIMNPKNTINGFALIAGGDMNEVQKNRRYQISMHTVSGRHEKF